MNIRELIDALQDIADEHGEQIEVRLAQQPSWPFEYSVSAVECVDLHDDEEEDADGLDRDEADEKIVYIGEGSQLGYLPGAVSQQLGWR